MKQFFLRSAAPAGLLILAAGVLTISAPQRAGASNAAIVFNREACTITTPNGEYDGKGAIVATVSGQVTATCSGSLVSGPGVTNTQHEDGTGLGLSCKIVENPGGLASGVCH